jgi:hypothetical protein
VPEQPPPSDGEVPAVLPQSWATDPGTMRRLVIGLRRLVD